MQFEDVRFLSSISVLLTHWLGLHLLAALALRAGTVGLLVQPLVLVVNLSLFIWFSVYGQWMSRARRAVFNEQNILLTYQPRALTHGHLFVPDPPTPAPDGKSGAAHGRLESCTASEFRAARDAHYKDEFNTARKTTIEQKFYPVGKVESMRIEFDESSSPSTASTKSAMSASPSPGHHI